MQTPQCVAISGLGTSLGRNLAARLARLPDGPRLIGIDQHRPASLPERIEFAKLDLTDPRASGRAAEIFERNGVDTLAHLAFRRSPSRDVEEDHELETLGTVHLLHACTAASIGRLVIASSTMLYGAQTTNPNYLDEGTQLVGHPDAHCTANRVEVESLAARWSERHPNVDVSVLRSCWVMGPTHLDRVVEHFTGDVVTTVAGYDPLLQFVHEEDQLEVFARAVLESHPGVFNVVGRGVMPLSTVIALAGKEARPRPMWWLDRIAAPEHLRRFGDRPAGFYDYLRFLCVADGKRGWDEFGEPVYSSREAWMSFVSSRRLRRYR